MFHSRVGLRGCARCVASCTSTNVASAPWPPPRRGALWPFAVGRSRKISMLDLAVSVLARSGDDPCLEGHECRRVRVRVRVYESERVRERRPQSRPTCPAESRSKNAKRERTTAATATQTTQEGGPEATPPHTVRHAPTAKRTLLEHRLQTVWKPRNILAQNKEPVGGWGSPAGCFPPCGVSPRGVWGLPPSGSFVARCC